MSQLQPCICLCPFFIHYIHCSLNVVFIFISPKAVMFLPVLFPDEKLNFCTMLSLVYYF